MISSASLNPSPHKISDKTSGTKQGDQPAGAFLELLNEFKQENNKDAANNLLAMVNTLFQQPNEQANQSITLVDLENNQQEQPVEEQQTRDDLLALISLFFKNDIDPSNPSLGPLEKALDKTNQQQETISFEKIAKLLAEVTVPAKDVNPSAETGQKVVEDTFKPTFSLKQKENGALPNFEFQTKFEGKEVIFQSFHPNGTAPVTSKEEQAPLPKVSVQQFFSEVVELLKNQASLKKASEFIEAKFSLTPEKLGDIDVQLSIHKGQVAAHFSAETLLGKESLESQISLLRSSLQQQGLQVDKIEITLSGQGLQHSFSQQEEKSRQEQSQQRFAKKKINIDDFYQSHSTIDEYKHNGVQNTINILA